MGDSNLEDKINKINEKGKESADKLENWSRKGWENMSDKQIKAYNTFYKTILIITAIMLLLLAIVFPPSLVLSIFIFYYAIKFDARKAKSDYGGYKYFIVFGGGICCIGIGFVLPPFLLLGAGLLYTSYRLKKANSKDNNDV